MLYSITVSDLKESSTNSHITGQYTSFDNIIGHEIFIKMLRVAIEKDIIHSFLFAGTRGIGKTSMARLLARHIICDNKNICKQCQACIDPIDIVEIDAATYTGVDSIREIIEQSTFKPLISHNKVFIIDEAHMLSKSAFNALLKTIEEPSKSAYFILATTELNKIPMTIRSRCLLCDLKPLSIENIKKYMTIFLTNYQYTDEILDILAKYAYGSIRDAKFILEKMFLVTENKIFTLDSVKYIFGFLPNDIKRIVKYIKISDINNALEIINNIEADPVFIIKEIANEIYYSDMNEENKIANYNIAINYIPLLKHFNDMQVVKIALMKMCSKLNTIDQLVEKAKDLFPDIKIE